MLYTMMKKQRFFQEIEQSGATKIDINDATPKNFEAFKQARLKGVFGEQYEKTTESERDRLDATMRRLYDVKKETIDLSLTLAEKNSKVFLLDNDTDKEKDISLAERIDMMEREIDRLSTERELLKREAEKRVVNTDGLTEGKRREDILSEQFGEIVKDKKAKEVIGEKNFDTITAGDFYAMKKAGIDLSGLLLVRSFGGEKVQQANIKTGDSFIVNFGTNKNAHEFIGAGDILPMDKVAKVKINGVEGTRGYNPRPGFYTPKGRYLSIYDGDTIEITEEKSFSEGEEKTYETSSTERFKEIRGSELADFINDAVKHDTNINSIEIPFQSAGDKELLEIYLKSVFPRDIQDNIIYNQAENRLTTKDGKPLKEMIAKIQEYQGNGTLHLRYMTTIQSLADKYQVPAGSIVRLIYHENRGWNPGAKAPGSTAYGLGQIINSTWETYGRGLNRDNPGDQLEATARYMQAIQKRKNCPWEHVLAYYNTGEGIKNLSDATIREYNTYNAPIRNKHPNKAPANANEYFIAAIAYYNDISYQDAEKTMNA